MLSKNQQIRKDKENKIKLLLSQFELCKQKIFQHKQERREQQYVPEPRKPQSVAKVQHQSHYPSSMRKTTEPSHQEHQIRRKLQKVQAVLAQKTLMWQHRENQLQDLLKQQQLHNIKLSKQFQSFTFRLKDKFELTLKNVWIDSNVYQRIQYYEEKIKYLNSILLEIRKSFQLNQQKSRTQIEEVIKQKLQLQIMCEQLQQKVLKNQVNQKFEDFQREIEELKNQNAAKQSTIFNLEKQFREQIKQYMRKIDEIDKTTGQNNCKAHQLELLKVQYQNELQHQKQERQDYEAKIFEYKKKIEHIQGEIHSNELNYQKQMQKLSLEIKRINQKMLSLQDEYGKKIQQTEKLKQTIKQMSKQVERLIQNDRKKDEQIQNQIRSVKQLQNKLLFSNNQISRLKDDVKKKSFSLDKGNEKKNAQVQIPSIYNKKQVQKYLNEIAQLKIALQVTNEQLKELKQSKSFNDVLQTPPKRTNSINEPNRIAELQTLNRQLELRIFEYKQQILDLKRQITKQKQKQIGSQRQLEQKQNIIGKLQDRKMVFENLFAQISKSNQKLNTFNQDLQHNKDIKSFNGQLPKTTIGSKTNNNNKQIKQQITKPMNKAMDFPKKKAQNHIKTNIKDLDIRLIDSDPQQTQSLEEQALSQIKQVEQFKQPQSFVEPNNRQVNFHPAMHHSFNPANKQLMELQIFIKKLQSEVELLKSQNQVLSKKKQSLQKQISQFQGRQQYFLQQKQRMKSQLAIFMSENNDIKLKIKRFLFFLATQNKSIIRTSFQYIRKNIFELADFVKETQLERQLGIAIQSKKGFFSIL